MFTLHQSLFWLHIVFGTMALILFWVPVLTKKGGLNHRRFGRYYSWVMYTVSYSAIIMALMVLVNPEAVKPGMLTNAKNPEQVLLFVRNFWALLLFLGVLVLTGIRYGNLVMACKADREPLRTWHHLALHMSLLVGSLWLLYIYFFNQGIILHLIFGCLGAVSVVQTFRYVFAKEITLAQLWRQHMEAMVGTGIGAYTAFLTFGTRRLFSEMGDWQWVFWILPGIVGATAITLLSKQYETKFKGKMAPKSRKNAPAA
ncbi:hypothetical protein [Pseudidiomarina aestuarii]|uniref:hypothetical protein n=1 Tax=Pseudidiomarina aestuarii TaxID=624146 RepID=UPI003A97DBC1